MRWPPRSTGLAWAGHSHTWLGLVDHLRGDWEAALVHFEEGVRLAPPGVLNGFGWALLFQQRAYAGEVAEALRLFDEKRDELPRPGQANTWGEWQLMWSVVEGLAVLGHREEAARLHPLITEAIESGVICGSYHDGRLLQRVAGIAAAAGCRWDVAEGHFLTALRQAEELPHRLEQAETRRFYGQVLIERDRSEDREKARRLLEEAITVYRRIGMPRHEETTRALLARAR